MTRSEIIALTRYDLCPYCTKTQLKPHNETAKCNNPACDWLRCVGCGINYDPVRGRMGASK